MNDRYRIVTENGGGERHVSSVLLGGDEIVESLDVEEFLHRASGWTVTRSPHCLIVRRGTSLRIISARFVDAFSDNLQALRKG